MVETVHSLERVTEIVKNYKKPDKTKIVPPNSQNQPAFELTCV